MKNKKWSVAQKVAILSAGIKGRPVASILEEHDLAESVYYRWRDQLLTHMGRVFSGLKTEKLVARLERENAELKKTIRQLKSELRKAKSSVPSQPRPRGRPRKVGVKKAMPMAPSSPASSESPAPSKPEPKRKGFWGFLGS